MNLQCIWRSIFFSTVFQKWSYLAALVIELDGLVSRRLVVARRRWLEDETIHGREDEQLTDKTWHLEAESWIL